MKRFLWIAIAMALVVVVDGCSKYTKEKNIMVYSEFVPCTDPDCEICGGDGFYECTVCGHDGQLTCTKCSGTGRVDCEGVKLLGLSDCRGGTQYFKNADTGEWFPMECDICYGTGKLSDGSVCWNCNGTGHEACDLCGGTGFVTCKSCDGDGLVTCTTCGGDGLIACGETVYYAWCHECNTRLDSSATVCTNCGAAAWLYVCKDCGAAFNEEFDVCPECGNE